MCRNEYSLKHIISSTTTNIWSRIDSELILYGLYTCTFEIRVLGLTSIIEIRSGQRIAIPSFSPSVIHSTCRRSYSTPVNLIFSVYQRQSSGDATCCLLNKRLSQLWPVGAVQCTTAGRGPRRKTCSPTARRTTKLNIPFVCGRGFSGRRVVRSRQASRAMTTSATQHLA